MGDALGHVLANALLQAELLLQFERRGQGDECDQHPGGVANGDEDKHQIGEEQEHGEEDVRRERTDEHRQSDATSTTILFNVARVVRVENRLGVQCQRYGIEKCDQTDGSWKLAKR